MTTLLSTADRNRLLPALGQTGWQAAHGLDGIRKIWKFRSFSEAWGFMSRVALAAEKANHHPDWSNKYNLVDVTLTTHSAKGLTQLDLDLAAVLDRLSPGAEVIAEHGASILSLCEIRAAAQP